MSDCGVGTLAPGVDFHRRQSGTGGQQTNKGHRIMTTQQIIAQIAQKHLRIETLKEQMSDRLDFHEVGVTSIEAALLAAFEAGRQAAK
jgi:hypothetical protein